MNTNTNLAADTLRIAALATTVRMGRKAMISSIWAQLRAEKAYNGLTLPAFKAELLKANKAGQLELVRLDLVVTMDSYVVKTSEIKDDLSTYHAVVVG